MRPNPRLDREIEAGRRRQLGAFYTPAPIVDAILDRALEPKLQACSNLAALRSLRVLDPACGDGRFLAEARVRIERRARELGARGSLARQIERRCLAGIDVDPGAIDACRARLPEARLECRDALEERDRCDDDGRFDVIVGNPPYGAETEGRGDSTRLFIARALAMLKADGAHGFVVPKAILYSSVWRSSAAALLDGLDEVIDCGRAWPEVKLEQVIYVYRRDRRAGSYRSGVFDSNAVRGVGRVEKTAFDEFGLLLHGVRPDEIAAARAMRDASAGLGDWSRNTRGAPLQASIQSKGDVPIVGGRELGRFRVAGTPRGYVSKDHLADRRAALDGPASAVVLAQNIVAHVKRPTPHLKIAAAAPAEAMSSWAVLDTINKIYWNGPYSRDAFLAILNSGPVAWYVYRFVVGLAVRTIHFDATVTARIPVPRRLAPSIERELAILARRMAEAPCSQVDARIDRLVLSAFDLGERVARAVRV